MKVFHDVANTVADCNKCVLRTSSRNRLLMHILRSLMHIFDRFNGFHRNFGTPCTTTVTGYLTLLRLCGLGWDAGLSAATSSVKRQRRDVSGVISRTVTGIFSIVGKVMASLSFLVKSSRRRVTPRTGRRWLHDVVADVAQRLQLETSTTKDDNNFS